MKSSLSPPEVPNELYVLNREKLLKSLRANLSSSSRPHQGFVFLQGGEEQSRYCTDHDDLFRQESYFAYLFGVKEPGFYGAIDVATGDSMLFAPRLPDSYAVWLGKIKPLSYFKEKYRVNKVFYTDEIVRVLLDLYKEKGNPLLFLLHGLNTDSNKLSKPADFQGIDRFKIDMNTLHPILAECRVIKSDLELAVIQFASDISSEAHIEVMRNIKILQDGDMALLDMGAEYHFYASDITCSYPVNGKFTPDQALIYNAVLDAHDAVISTLKPGICWVDMHKLAEKVIMESLKKGNLLEGDVEKMMGERLGAVFMPHGLGHFLGIDTHDVGGYLKGAERPKEPGLSNLRTSRELSEGMVITVEPGCYFIEALLLPAMESSKTSKFFKHEEICRFRGSGGVRIESDVRITADGCINMTKCPRKIEDIEAVMAGAPWTIS